MHGYESPEEMMENVKDTTLQVWVDPEKRAEYKRQLADTGFALGFESQGRRKDGTIIWGLVNARAVRDNSGRLLYYEGSVQDITERKRAEAALRFTQFAVDHASDAAFWIKPDGSFFYVNDAACQVLGYTREELLSMTVPDIDPDYPQETWADHWQEMREKGSYTFEAHHRTKDGRVFPVEITTNHLDYGGHEFNCAFARDITEGKRAEKELRTLSTYLLRTQDQERRRIGRELHDSTAQKLAALGMNLSLINGSAASVDSKAHKHLLCARSAHFPICCTHPCSMRLG
jgi:PAS domain S-box-containing protein